MKALVKYALGHGNVKIEDMEEPKIASDQVLIEVKAAGICGTDLHIYEGTFPTNPPVIIGHEFSGEIVKVGGNVKCWRVGDRVVSETHAYTCRVCYYCKSGMYNLCLYRKGLGYIVNGAFTEYVAAASACLHKIPDNISYDEAAIIEPLADTVHAVVSNTQIQPSDTVVVLGPGPIGILAAQVAETRGATQVIVTGRGKYKTRLRVAAEVYAYSIVDVEEEDPVKRVKELTGGLGADVVLEAAGSPDSMRQALEMVRKKGQITLIGVYSRPVELDLNNIVLKELILRGTYINRWIDWERAINLITTGKVRVKPLITHKFPLTDWEKAFKVLREKEAIKVILLP